MRPGSHWTLEVFSDETEWLLDEIDLPGLLAREVREILNVSEDIDIRDGVFPLHGEPLQRIAERVGYRPVRGASFFLAYDGDGTLV
jgi:hypothetical protein